MIEKGWMDKCVALFIVYHYFGRMEEMLTVWGPHWKSKQTTFLLWGNGAICCKLHMVSASKKRTFTLCCPLVVCLFSWQKWCGVAEGCIFILSHYCKLLLQQKQTLTTSELPSVLLLIQNTFRINCLCSVK